MLMIPITKADKVEYWQGGLELSEEVEPLAHFSANSKHKYSSKYMYNSKYTYSKHNYSKYTYNFK